MDPTGDLSDPRQLLIRLQALRASILQEGCNQIAQWHEHLDDPHFLPSATNLAYYLALRRRDLRAVQAALMPWGLSSLGRSESRVLPTLDAVITTLGKLVGVDAATLPGHPRLADFFAGNVALQQHVVQVFGQQAHPGRQILIMATLPTAAAADPGLIDALVVAGMDCARINCAHDAPAQWEQMIRHVRTAAAKYQRDLRVMMDIGGPKPRTVAIVAPEGEGRLMRQAQLLLRRGSEPSDTTRFPWQTGCSIPAVIGRLHIGDAVWIDDGHLGARVEDLLPEGAVLRVTEVRPHGVKLQPDKGLNFPDTLLDLAPLTATDLHNLDFIAQYADIVGYSFVQSGADIALLQEALRARQGDRPLPAIIAKIETSQAVKHLPEIIIQAAGQGPFGVMIARGDLAVEIGYLRMVEIQEEILWVCEAAHVPVIWATQVLETLVRKGTPSRAEMTDAAMAERAECVMLNKGPFLAEAITLLAPVLTSMEAMQSKKTPQLRALQMWQTLAQ